MPRSSRLFLFPDINVWIALTYQRHVHHPVASRWFEGLAPTSRLFFCRFTQLGLLRLLTAEAVMRPDKPMSQAEAWRTYDLWMRDARVEYLDEPADIEPHFRGLTRLRQAAPKDWADSYLAAFAATARLTLVTFDRGFHHKAKELVVLIS
jgi:uncharacterized protein